MNINLYNEDSLEAMRKMPDKCYDLAIVDPPYGIGFDREFIVMSAGVRADGSKRKMKEWNNPRPKLYGKKDWDCATPNEEYFKELRRVSRSQIIWGGNYFTDKLAPSGGWVIWEKGVPDGMTLSQAELAWTNCANNIKICKVLWAGYKKYEPEDRIHPTQKPVKLYKWLLKNYAKEGDKILDTHGGSGSILIACYDMGFSIDWYEIDKDYFDAAKKRFENHKKQLQLFRA